jgi:hypothetical protein
MPAIRTEWSRTGDEAPAKRRALQGWLRLIRVLGAVSAARGVPGALPHSGSGGFQFEIPDRHQLESLSRARGFDQESVACGVNSTIQTQISKRFPKRPSACGRSSRRGPMLRVPASIAERLPEEGEMSFEVDESRTPGRALVRVLRLLRSASGRTWPGCANSSGSGPSVAVSRSGCAQARRRQRPGRLPGRRGRSRGLTPLGRTRHRAILGLPPP